ncbi:hypothetical protein QJQ45_022696, partial [Haematococcus lacustris]
MGQLASVAVAPLAAGVSQMLKEALRQFPAGRLLAQGHAPLSCADGKPPSQPKPGQPGQDWVYLPDMALLRKWRR